MSTSISPALAQRRQALQKANEIRVRRANLKRELHDMTKPESALKVASIIQHPEPWIASMRVGELLKASRGLGPVKVTRFLTKTRVPYSRHLEALTPRQRGELVQELEGVACR